MAMHQASINIQEPTKFKLEATRTKVEYYFHLELNSKQALKSERNSKTQLYKFEQELLQASRIRFRTLSNQNPKSADLNHGKLCSSNNKFCNRWCGNLRPEGNIQPNPFNFLQLIKSLNKLNSETWRHMHTSEFLNFRCQTFLCRILPIQNLSVLAHELTKIP